MINTDSTEWRNALASALQPGDTVIINDRSRALTVTDRTVHDGCGSTYPHHYVWLEGNGTEYILVHHDIDDYDPTLYSASDWRVIEHDNIEDEIMFETGAGEQVRHIETDNETAIVADITADDYIQPTIPESKWANDYQPNTDHIVTGEEIGTCPSCNATVIETDNKATCTSCELWCPIDEWNAHHNT